MKARILSHDGGGMRGIIPAVVIKYIEDQLQILTNNTNARIADFFDIIVGTRTGGILACFYLTPNPGEASNPPTTKFTASQALNFYESRGYEIFNASKRWGPKIINSTKYNPKAIESIFNESFGDLKLSELLKPCIVTTYDLNSKTAVFFNSREETAFTSDFFVRDVVRSTSAAPTYFPPAKIALNGGASKMVNIDGGVFANNPAMCAYAECRKTKFARRVDYPSAKDMLILSIGTGGGQFELPNIEKSKNWWIGDWAKSIPEIMMDGSVDTVDHQMLNLFSTLEDKYKKNYKRINVPINSRSYSSNMADA
jgi:patatin-like phospholipase/acyl hydrolase